MSKERLAYIEEMVSEIHNDLDSLNKEEQERVAVMTNELIQVLKKDSDISMLALAFLFFQGLKNVFSQEQESTDS